MAARASRLGDEHTYSAVDDTDDQSCRPDFAVLVYPAYLDNRRGDVPLDIPLPTAIPPTLIVHTEDDESFIDGSKRYDAALSAANVRHEFRLYATGGHGYGLRSEREAKVWPTDMLAWLRAVGIHDTGC